MLFPISRLIRGIVMEKETKLQEGMRMMGLSDAALLSSWLATYFVMFLVISALVTIITRRNIFKGSDGFLVFLTFLLFGMSSEAYSYLISVFFSRARSASTLGIILFLGGFFPYFAVGSTSTATNSAKTAACLLSPTAFGLALDQLAVYEDQGTGINFSNALDLTLNFQFANALGMMAFDIVLYLFLAWYIDGVLPARFREFGVPRVWYFPCTRTYWREVFGLPTAPAKPPSTPSTSLLNGSTAANPTSTAASAAKRHNGPKADPSFFEAPDSALQAREREGKVVTIRGLRKEFNTPDGIKVSREGREGGGGRGGDVSRLGSAGTHATPDAAHVIAPRPSCTSASRHAPPFLLTPRHAA
jgi:hypothetical protein